MTLALSAPVAPAAEAPGVRALLAEGDLQAALNAAAAAATADPRDAESQFLHGFVLLQMQRDAEALAVFTRLTQDYPELPDPYNNIALLHARGGRLELARQALESALRTDPGHRSARINLGQVHLMMAVQAWEQAAAVAPLEAPAQRRLEAARLLLSTGSMAAR